MPRREYSATVRFSPTQQDSDGRLILEMAQKIIHSREVKVQLSGVFGSEGAHLQIDDHEAAQPKMIEEKIDIKILTADFKMILAADEGKADPEFQEKLAEMIEGTSLQIPLLRFVGQSEEIKLYGSLSTC